MKITLCDIEQPTETVLHGSELCLSRSPERCFRTLTVDGNSMTISFFTEIAITADGRRIDAVVNGVHCPNCSRITVECAEVTADFSDEQFQFSFYSCHMEGDVDLKAKEI